MMHSLIRALPPYNQAFAIHAPYSEKLLGLFVIKHNGILRQLDKFGASFANRIPSVRRRVNNRFHAEFADKRVPASRHSCTASSSISRNTRRSK